MVIEWLKFRMDPENREAYIQADTEIWTQALEQYPGFVSKEVWIDPEEPDAVFLIIRWASRDQWKAIPSAELERISQKFDAVLGFSYELVAFHEYQVRRFPLPR
jgi:uncharacterized protein (TIGR03792 family)